MKYSRTKTQFPSLQNDSDFFCHLNLGPATLSSGHQPLTEVLSCYISLSCLHSKGTALVVFLCLVLPVNNTRFPFPQQLSQLPQSTESEAGGWGGESYKEIRESLTSLGRSMGCFTRKMEED